MPYCSDCGQQVGSEVRFCPNCGSEIRGWEDESTPGDQTGQGGHDHSGGPDGEQSGTAGSQQRGQQGTRGGGSRTRSETGATTETEATAETGPATGAATGTDHAGASESTQNRATETGAAAGTGATAGTGAPAGTGATAGTATGEAGLTNPDGAMPFDSGAFGHALGYPRQDDYDPVLIGALIEFVGGFIPFVNLIVRGYGLRLARASARGQQERPEWGDYGGMFVDGLKIVAVSLAFWLAWGAVGGILGGGTFLVSDTAGIAVFGLVLFVASLLFPASLVTYAAHDSFGSAFSPSYAGAFLTSLSYVKAYVLTALLSFAFVLVLAISVLTIVGPFVVLAFGTYFFFSFWGYYYREAVAAGSAPPAPADPVSAD